MRNTLVVAAVALSAIAGSAIPAAAQGTLKLGYIDPLSGGGASIGEGGLK
ncbi:MAG: branched-chain amino acid ABC transporter substrate-binding protein, partial [Bradyrhizobium sp.]